MRGLASVAVLAMASLAVADADVIYEYRAEYYCVGTMHGAPFTGLASLDWKAGTWALRAVREAGGRVCATALDRPCVADEDCRVGACIENPIAFDQTISGEIQYVSDTEFDAVTAYPARGATLRFTRDHEDRIAFVSGNAGVEFASCVQQGRHIVRGPGAVRSSRRFRDWRRPPG